MRKWLSIGLVIVMALSLVIGILGPTVASAKEKGATDTVKAFIKALPNLKKTNTTAGYWVVDGQDNVKAKLDAMPKDTKISLKLSGKLATKGQDTGPATVIGKYKLEVKYQKVKSSGQQTITFTLDKKGNPKKYPWLISNCDLDLGSLKVVSKFSEYGGYSLPIYDEYVRSSQYVKMRDGTKLAVDIFRPAVDGKAVSKPWPVIWIAENYNRAMKYPDGTLMTEPKKYPYLQTLIKYGYIVAAVDIRGTGASYGTRLSEFSQDEVNDTYDLTEWFASQPWCDGNVGMDGGSYAGLTQYWAATTKPPHLKAIFPGVASFDSYSSTYPGGIFCSMFLDSWTLLTKYLDQTYPAPPVDEDINGSMYAEAKEQQKGNVNTVAEAAARPYRPLAGSKYAHLLEYNYGKVKDSGIPIYHLEGWYDLFAPGAELWFNNLDNPQKVTIGPWYHPERDDDNALMAAEHLRWYDYWLKGIKNGVMDDQPFHYYTVGAPEGQGWHATREWPLPNEKPTNYYFSAGPSGSVSSINDGLLSTTKPEDTTGKDNYTVDYTITTGLPNPLHTRWSGVMSAKMYKQAYGVNPSNNFTPLDEKGLTYTTSPLQQDVEVTGHPVVHLTVSSTASDGDFYVYLEDVDSNGISKYMSDGYLRASQRAVTKAPWNNLGLPWQSHYEADASNLPPGEPVELDFALYPSSNIFHKGDRIRVTITCADSKSFFTPELSPAPTVSVYRDTDHASYISLPIIAVGNQ